MKKFLLCLACVTLLSSMWAIGISVADNKPQENASAYGFLIADDLGSPVGFYTFPLNDAHSPVMVTRTPRISAGALAGNHYYAMTYTSGVIATPLAWNSFDLTTGELTKLADADDDTPLYVDMTYDYTTNRLLAICHYDGNSTKLVSVNPEDGTSELILDIPQQWMLTLAATFDGEIYMIGRGRTLSYYLYRVDERNNIEVVGQIETADDYLQSMTFDHNTGKLYWASTTDSSSYFYEVNILTGACRAISSLGTGAEITGLYIPVSMAKDGTPAAVDDLAVTNPAHDKKVTISFTVPSKTVDNKALTNISGWTISCDNVALDIPFKSVTPGQRITLETEIETGLHIFKVQLSNGIGEGAPALRKFFVGVDVPAAPRDVKVEANGNKAVITWSPVSTGASGGWINTSDMKYNVIRKPDNKTIASGTSGTRATDEVDVMNAYQYVVTAVSSGKEGEIAASELIAVGEGMTLPYSCDFTQLPDHVLWTTTDCNSDGYTWQFSTIYGEPAMLARSTDSYACDEWLVSPPLRLEAGKEYKISYDVGAMSPYNPPSYSLALGSSANPDDLTDVFHNGTTDASYPTHSIIYLPEITTSGYYHIGVHAKWNKGLPALYFGNVRIEENHASRMTLTVTDNNSKPIAGAKVLFGASKTPYTTNSKGETTITEIEPGNHDLYVEKFGFATQKRSFTFTSKQDRRETIALEPLKVTTVSGNVRFADGRPAAHASVFVHGYDVYSTEVAPDGSFSIANVYVIGDYTVEAHATNYLPASASITGITGQPVRLEDFVLEEKLTSPANLKGQPTRDKVVLVWDAPVDRETTFRYDDGTAGMINTFSMSPDVCDNTATGVVYETPAVYTGMSFRADDKGDMRVLVFDLDEKGEPTGNLLYQQTVKGDDGDWVDVTFSHPVIAPRGAMFALAGDTRLYFDGSLDGTRDEAYPIRSNKMWLSYDYTNLAEMPFHWRMYEDPYPLFRSNLCIRAKGLELGAPRSKAASANAAPAATKGYLVWRLPEGSESKQSDWKLLTDNPIQEPSFIDNTWISTSKGMYRYAVKAMYEGRELSFATLSDAIPCRMTSSVGFTLLSNAPGESTAGAKAVLVEKTPGTHSYYAVADANGVLHFADVWEGDYTLTVTCAGFATLNEDVTVSGEKDLTASYTLTETTEKPFNLVAEETDRPDAWLLRWNFKTSIFEDFESYDDFTVDPTGDIAWSYVDADGLVVGIINDLLPDNDCAAFVVLSPETSGHEKYTVAHSGKRAVCSLAARWDYIPVDDYIISPELSFKDKFVLSFWAYTYWKVDDYYRVGYSTTGKDIRDFIWFDKHDMEEEKWLNPTFEIPADARYVAINYRCTKMVGVIDDIYIGPADEIPNVTAQKPLRAPGKVLKYEVYLDGNKLTETNETQFLLKNLSTGTHSAGVKSVYASGATEMAQVNFLVLTSGIDEIASDGYVVNAHNGIIEISGVSAEDHIIVADMSGRTYPVTQLSEKARASVGSSNLCAVSINGDSFIVLVK